MENTMQAFFSAEARILKLSSWKKIYMKLQDFVKEIMLNFMYKCSMIFSFFLYLYIIINI